jgi:hypothetical protein
MRLLWWTRAAAVLAALAVAGAAAGFGWVAYQAAARAPAPRSPPPEPSPEASPGPRPGAGPTHGSRAEGTGEDRRAEKPVEITPPADAARVDEVEVVAARVLFERDKNGVGLDPRPELKLDAQEATDLASYFPGVRGPKEAAKRGPLDWKSRYTIVFEVKGGEVRAVHVSPDGAQWWWRDSAALGLRRAREGQADRLDRLQARAKDAR